jgi:hypothetical protein
MHAPAPKGGLSTFAQIAVAIRVLGSPSSGMDLRTVHCVTCAQDARQGGCQVIDIEQNPEMVHQWRQGVCHRCGWRGSVGKIRRRYRRQLKPLVDFGRLCDDCVTTVLNGQSVTPHPYWAHRAEPKPDRRRQVA